MCSYMMKDNIDQCCIGFLRHNCTKLDNYNGALIHVVAAIAPDNAEASRKAKFHHFCRWANVDIIGMIKHHRLSGDEEHSRKKYD